MDEIGVRHEGMTVSRVVVLGASAIKCYLRAMPSLLVRKVDPELIESLKRRAAANGRSVEAEHRAILQQALRPVVTGMELVRRLRGPVPLPDDFEDYITQSTTTPAKFE
jgi:antitoxin FitA